MAKEFHIDYSAMSELYAKERPEGTLYLAFRDIPDLLKRHLVLNPSRCALDFGCGTGVSTRYLKALNLFAQKEQVEGVDVSEVMLRQAKKVDPSGVYKKIEENQIPTKDAYYQLVFSTFVLYEFASVGKMAAALKEVCRVMTNNAIFIAVTGSAEAYDRRYEWVSLKNNFPENHQLKSGNLGRLDFIQDQDILTFHNYYWLEEDYKQAFQQAGLTLIETLYPKGRANEQLPWKWKSELYASPYYTFVLKKAVV